MWLALLGAVAAATTAVDCPSRDAVERELKTLAPPGAAADSLPAYQLTARQSTLVIIIESAKGARLIRRELPLPAQCDERARVAAVVIASTLYSAQGPPPVAVSLDRQPTEAKIGPPVVPMKATGVVPHPPVRSARADTVYAAIFLQTDQRGADWAVGLGWRHGRRPLGFAVWTLAEWPRDWAFQNNGSASVDTVALGLGPYVQWSTDLGSTDLGSTGHGLSLGLDGGPAVGWVRARGQNLALNRTDHAPIAGAYLGVVLGRRVGTWNVAAELRGQVWAFEPNVRTVASDGTTTESQAMPSWAALLGLSLGWWP